MFAACYLQVSRHGIYYFRIAIPRSLRDRFTGSPREIKQSLRTSDRAIAFARARKLHVKLDEIFSELREEMEIPFIKKWDLAVDAAGRVTATDIKEGEGQEAAKAMATLIDKLKEDRLRTQAEQVPQSTLLPPTSNRVQHKLAHEPLSKVVEKYLVQYKPGVTDQTYKRREGHLQVFIEYFSDAKISDITRARLSEYWDDLAYLPPQKDVRPEFLHWRLDKVLQVQKKLVAENMPMKGLSKQTQAHYREAVSGFFEWCSERDIIDANIAARKSKRSKKYRNEVANVPREIFTIDDLKRIFESDFYMCGEYIHPYQYWIPHIALYTGARINEISQLYVTDISKFEEILTIKFCATESDEDENGERVLRSDVSKKNENSTRLTPVHPKLIDLGLLEFIKTLKDEGQERLFPELKFAKKGGYGTRASRWFSDYLREKVGIKNPAKVFHSFRHTVFTGLSTMLFDMPEGRMIENKDMIVKAIVGHRMEGITFGHYNKNFHPRTTSLVLNSLAWGVDLTPYVSKKRKRLRNATNLEPALISK